MKKLLIVVLIVSILAVAGIALAGISNTPHDLRINKATLAVEPCAFCHTPHQGPNNVQINGVNAFVPLWNRSQGTQAYTGYSSNTAQMLTNDAFALGAGTAECMVCHNGQLSELVNYPGSDSVKQANYNLAVGAVAGWANVGTDLRNEHPVGFSYNPAFDSENNGFPARATVGGRRVIGTTTYNYPLYGGAVGSEESLECGSCHSVHHTFAAGVGDYKSVALELYQVYFLRTSNVGSAMCRACHVNR